MKHPLTFAKVTDLDGRVSSLGMYGMRDELVALTVVGVLANNSRIVPASVGDADLLIDWLRDWRDEQFRNAAHVVERKSA